MFFHILFSDDFYTRVYCQGYYSEFNTNQSIQNFNFWFVIHQFALDYYHFVAWSNPFFMVSRWKIYKKWNNSIENTRINVPALDKTLVCLLRPCPNSRQIGTSHRFRLSELASPVTTRSSFVRSDAEKSSSSGEERSRPIKNTTDPRTAADCWRVNFTHDYLPGCF